MDCADWWGGAPLCCSVCATDSFCAAKCVHRRPFFVCGAREPTFFFSTQRAPVRCKFQHTMSTQLSSDMVWDGKSGCRVLAPPGGKSRFGAREREKKPPHVAHVQRAASRLITTVKLAVRASQRRLNGRINKAPSCLATKRVQTKLQRSNPKRRQKMPLSPLLFHVYTTCGNHPVVFRHSRLACK